MKSRWGKWLALSAVGSALGAVGFLGVAMIGTVVLILGAGTASQTSTTATFGSANIPTHGGRVSASQQEFAARLVACSQYLNPPGAFDPYVALALAVAEGGAQSPGQPTNNFLFIGGAGGPSYASVEDGAQAVCTFLRGSSYAGVRASLTQAPILQLLAWAQSPWDGGFVPWGDSRGHYGGDGRNLLSAYYSLLGSTSCQVVKEPC